ncbi:6-bladed beta-propeller [Fodinibius halophilus]|uniref:6-bladed beta-propeller n=1 Tax=Fodinibius halophilus TaxID=1736908 RepID=A0A6M1T015_9BACT|nr:6-bladed beta-propeller [Fodinibius halophilus]NGP87287.1 6-bladed beta-propeller [Fodinibius halophilus]
MRTKISVIIVFFLIVSCGSPDDPYAGEYIELSFEERLTFGQPDSLSKSTIHYARDLRLGPAGRIYVADAGVSKIKVYSPEGKLVNSFGKRGRGPGELTGIKGFAVTDSTVLVWDKNIQRMSIFGLDGQLRTVRNFEGLPSPMYLYPFRNSYLALHGDGHYGNQFSKTRLGHIYSSDFSDRKKDFLILDEVNEHFEDISQLLLTRFGNILIQDNQKFLFIPIIYNGNIYEYSKNSSSWGKEHSYKGLNQQLPYSIVENGNERKPDGRISSVNISKDIQFIAHNMSRGLLKYNGYLFHFTFSDIDDKRVLGVEVYDENVSPIGYSPIKSIPISNERDNYLSWSVEEVDENGNFYFLQRNDKGMQVRVMQVNHEDLERLSE